MLVLLQGPRPRRFRAPCAAGLPGRRGGPGAAERPGRAGLHRESEATWDRRDERPIPLQPKPRPRINRRRTAACALAQPNRQQSSFFSALRSGCGLFWPWDARGSKRAPDWSASRLPANRFLQRIARARPGHWPEWRGRENCAYPVRRLCATTECASDGLPLREKFLAFGDKTVGFGIALDAIMGELFQFGQLGIVGEFGGRALRNKSRARE